MADITPIVKTHVSNITRQDTKYAWYPPHGLFVPARGSVIVEGDVMSLTKPLNKQLLVNDLQNRRVKLAIEIPEQKGVSVYGAKKTKKEEKAEEVEPEVVKPEPIVKPEVKKALEEAKSNEDAITDKLDKLEKGKEKVEPFAETFQNKTIEEMKPPVTNLFGDDWEEAGTKKADVETVDMFGEDSFKDKDTLAAEAQAAKKAASIAKGLATRAANKAKKEAEAKAALSIDSTLTFGNVE